MAVVETTHDVGGAAEPVTSATQSLGEAVAPATADASVWAVPWSAVAPFPGIVVVLWRVRRKIRALRSGQK